MGPRAHGARRASAAAAAERRPAGKERSLFSAWRLPGGGLPAGLPLPSGLHLRRAHEPGHAGAAAKGRPRGASAAGASLHAGEPSYLHADDEPSIRDDHEHVQAEAQAEIDARERRAADPRTAT